MQRYPPGVLPKNGAIQSAAPMRDSDPLHGAEQLCAMVRAEHGRTGVSRFLAALPPFLPGEFIRQLAQRVGVDAPHTEEPQKEKQASAPQMKPEQLLRLMNLAGGGNDPASLLKLFSEMNGK